MIIKSKSPDILGTVGENRSVQSKSLVVSFRLQPGQKVFECNLKYGSIVPAEYKTTTADLSGKVRHSIDVKAGCVYVPAINEKNAFKKIAKSLK